VLGVEVAQVGHQVLEHALVWKWIDADVATANLLAAAGAGERVDAVDIHSTGTADALAARAAQRERRIDLVLYLQQRIEHHRSTLIHVERVAVDAWAGARGRIEAVDAEYAHVLRARGRRIILAGLGIDAGIGG